MSAGVPTRAVVRCALPDWAWLLLAEYQVHHPAPADMRRVRVATMREYLVAVASGVLQRVGQDRHRREVARLVHLPGEGEGGVCTPRRGERHRPRFDVVEERGIHRADVSLGRGV